MIKKIAITGATGFLGKYLVHDLRFDKNIELFLYSTSVEKLRKTFPNLPDSHFIETDYTYNSLKNSFSNYHAVIHLAAKRMLPDKTDIATYWCNVEQTENLLRVSDSHQVAVFVFASTTSVYDSSKNIIPFVENETPYPLNAYGISKWVCENLSSKFNTKMVNLRFSQLIGWGEREGYMFTQSLNKIIGNQPITLWGKGGGGRDYLYTKDAVSIIKSAIDKKLPGTFNVGSGTSISFKELVETMVEVFGTENSMVYYDTSKTENTDIRSMSIEKVNNVYGWKPAHSLKSALTDMKQAWLNENMDKA
jgi:UDP-glucose 4-epimerase